MKTTAPFDLERARAGAALVTRLGAPVTIYTFERRFAAYPIVGAIHSAGCDLVTTWTPEGRATRLEKPHDNDLLLSFDTEISDC